MTFEQWAEVNKARLASLTPADFKLVELGWIAAKVDEREAQLDRMMIDREAA